MNQKHHTSTPGNILTLNLLSIFIKTDIKVAIVLNGHLFNLKTYITIQVHITKNQYRPNETNYM